MGLLRIQILLKVVPLLEQKMTKRPCQVKGQGQNQKKKKSILSATTFSYLKSIRAASIFTNSIGAV